MYFVLKPKQAEKYFFLTCSRKSIKNELSKGRDGIRTVSLAATAENIQSYKKHFHTYYLHGWWWSWLYREEYNARMFVIVRGDVLCMMNYQRIKEKKREASSSSSNGRSKACMQNKGACNNIFSEKRLALAHHITYLSHFLFTSKNHNPTAPTTTTIPIPPSFWILHRQTHYLLLLLPTNQTSNANPPPPTTRAHRISSHDECSYNRGMY